MPWSDHQRAWHWSPGDRLAVAYPYRDNGGPHDADWRGTVERVMLPKRRDGDTMLMCRQDDTGEAFMTSAGRVKPIVRVKAPSRQTIVELGAFHTSFFDCLDAMGGRVIR